MSELRERVREALIAAEPGSAVDAVMAVIEQDEPKVLWAGETRFLGSRSDPRPDQSWFVGGFVLDVPAGTKIKVVEDKA